MAADSPNRRKIARTTAITIIVCASAIGIVTGLRGIDWAKFGAALLSLSPLPLACALAVSTLQVFSQLGRFVVLLPKSERRPLRELLDATAVGQLINYAAPLRSGDAYKVLRLSARRDAPSGRASVLVAALVAERAADVIALLVVTCWASLSTLARLEEKLEVSRVSGKVAAIGATIAIALAGGAWMVVSRRPAILKRWAGHLWDALSTRRFAQGIAVALVTWLLDAATLFCTSRAGGFAIPLRGAMQAVFVLNLGIAVPITAGNVGVFEAALAFALTEQGVPIEHALVIATLEHFAKFAGLGLCVGILRLGSAPAAAAPSST